MTNKPVFSSPTFIMVVVYLSKTQKSMFVMQNALLCPKKDVSFQAFRYVLSALLHISFLLFKRVKGLSYRLREQGSGLALAGEEFTQPT